MKKEVYSMVLVALAGSVLLASAQDDTEKRRSEHGKMHGQMLKQFDKDGDGKLSESEKAAMKAAMEERRARADTDGDGKVSDAERKAAREKMMQRFDTDGDGKISEAERKAAREQHRQHAKTE